MSTRGIRMLDQFKENHVQKKEQAHAALVVVPTAPPTSNKCANAAGRWCASAPAIRPGWRRCRCRASTWWPTWPVCQHGRRHQPGLRPDAGADRAPAAAHADRRLRGGGRAGRHAGRQAGDEGTGVEAVAEDRAPSWRPSRRPSWCRWPGSSPRRRSGSRCSARWATSTWRPARGWRTRWR